MQGHLKVTFQLANEIAAENEIRCSLRNLSRVTEWECYPLRFHVKKANTWLRESVSNFIFGSL